MLRMQIRVLFDIKKSPPNPENSVCSQPALVRRPFSAFSSFCSTFFIREHKIQCPLRKLLFFYLIRLATGTCKIALAPDKGLKAKFHSTILVSNNPCLTYVTTQRKYAGLYFEVDFFYYTPF